MAKTTAELIAHYETELDAVHTRILAIEGRDQVAESQGGRDVAYHPMRSLESLQKREQYLLSRLRRLKRSGGGIPIRTGVPVR